MLRDILETVVWPVPRPWQGQRDFSDAEATLIITFISLIFAFSLVASLQDTLGWNYRSPRTWLTVCSILTSKRSFGVLRETPFWPHQDFVVFLFPDTFLDTNVHLNLENSSLKSAQNHPGKSLESKWLTSFVWEKTTTFLMWPWPVRMGSRWVLTRWSSLHQVHSFKTYWRKTNTHIHLHERSKVRGSVSHLGFPLYWRNKHLSRKFGIFPCHCWWASFGGFNRKRK